MPNTDDSTPFIIEGETIGHIHHDTALVPYLLIHDEQGNSWRIYGYAQVSCAEGGGGEWHPQRRAQDKMLRAWQKNRKDLQDLAGLLGDGS